MRIGRLNENNELVPYHDRAAIEAGALDGQKLEICWLKSSLDLLTIQIEGSGRVILEDGTPLRVSFDSHNGYAFSSVERVLVDRHIIARKDISTQIVRDWMASNRDEAAKVRTANRSYVFFRITDLTNEGEPVGAQGVPLTPGRSIAVDRAHQYGGERGEDFSTLDTAPAWDDHGLLCRAAPSMATPTADSHLVGFFQVLLPRTLGRWELAALVGAETVVAVFPVRRTRTGAHQFCRQ